MDIGVEKLIFHDNALPWLLEPEDPSIRYWTLVDILGCSQDDREVQEARSAIMASQMARDIFSQQREDGSWGRDATKPFNADGTLATLGILRILGVPPDERTYAGCRSFLKYSQSKNGGFSYVKCRPSAVFPCSTGEYLPLMSYFQLADEPGIDHAFQHLINSIENQNSFVCSRYQGQVCLWGAIASLNGLSVLPQSMRSERTQRLVQLTANLLLDASYDFSGEHRRWLSFGVPRAWDLLSALTTLARHDYMSDRRFLQLFERVLSLQDERGRWLCGSVSRTWALERRGRPSKWVTLDVFRLFKRMGRLI